MTSPSPHKSVTVWLVGGCAMIFVMALLGAVTRLTESGLSITTWDPIMGVVPPLTPADWQQAFAGYQAIPQYQTLHSDMTLEAFKHIYFWEWLHRLWGRLIGVVFAVPLLVFMVQGRIDRRTGLKFALIFALGALQGFIGWFMVQSGLDVRTSVSPYRLALHLGFALMIYAILLWTVQPGRTKSVVPATILGHGWAALILLASTIGVGAMVAGFHAGSFYNTWPLMGGEWLPAAPPEGLETAVLVQFLHRWLGPLTMVALVAWVGRCRPIVLSQRRWLLALGGMAVLQVGLGIATLLTAVPIYLGVAHQAGAITLLTLAVINVQRLRTNK